MIAALSDEHVAGALVHALRQRGVDVATLQERGLRGSADRDLLALALREQRMMLTNDTDFLALASEFGKQQEPFAPVVYWPQQRRSVRYLLSRIIPLVNQGYEELCSRIFHL